MIGYCPQFDAIYEKLTGKETLKLMAILRGISPINVNRQVNKWIKLLGTLNSYGYVNNFSYLIFNKLPF